MTISAPPATLWFGLGPPGPPQTVQDPGAASPITSPHTLKLYILPHSHEIQTFPSCIKVIQVVSVCFHCNSANSNSLFVAGFSMVKI